MYPHTAVGSGLQGSLCARQAAGLLLLIARLYWVVSSGQWGPRNFLPLNGGTCALTAWGQWAVKVLLYSDSLLCGGGKCMELLLRLASMPWGSGQGTFFYALPHCLGGPGCGTHSVHCPTTWGSRQ